MQTLFYWKPGMGARMMSSPSPASLNPGEFALLQNVRIGARGMKTRLGMARVGSSPAQDTSGSGATRRGAKLVRINGVEYPVIISSPSGGGHVAAYWVNTTSGAWTEITAASGQYGSTRFSGSSSDHYSLEVVTDPQTEKDYLVINGLNQNPRVWDGSLCATHAVITPPSSRALLSSVPAWPKFFDVANEGNNSFTNSGANWAAADTGANPDHYFTLTRNTTVESNPTVILTFSSAVDLSDCPSMPVVFECSNIALWENIKVEINDGGYSTVWDPQDATYAKDEAVISGNYKQVAFPLNQIAAASRNGVTDVRLTWVGKEPGSSITCNIFAICGSGKVQGECQHAISYLNSASRAESIGLVVANVMPKRVSEMGGPNIDGLRIANDSDFLYTYEINFQNPSTAQKDLGVDTLVVYRNDPGDIPGEFYYVGTTALATYSAPNWSFSSGSTLSVRTYSDVSPAEDKNLSFTAPDAYHETIPGNGIAMATGSSRFFVGRYFNGTTYSSELWISQLNHPFRFRREAKVFGDLTPDLSSPVMNRIPGDNLMALKATQTDKLDVAGIYVVTTGAVFALSGLTTPELSRMRRVSQDGTYYPESVVEHRGGIFWTDVKGDIQAYGPNGSGNLSRSVVDGRMSALQGWGGNFQISAAAFKDIIYTSYDTAGSTSPASITKRKTLVWDTDQRAFVEDDQAGTLGIDYWLPGANKLYCIASDGYLYEYEKAATTGDNGSAFTTQITGGEMHNEMWTPVHVGLMGIVCDDGASSTWTTTRTFRKDGSTSAGSITTDVSTNQAWRWDDASPRPGGYGLSCQPDWTSSTYPGGKNIFALPIEVEGVTWDGADVG